MLEEEYNPRRKLPPHLAKQPEPEPPFAFSIREAVEADIPDIREIYNHYVANSTVTFDEEPQTLKELRTQVPPQREARLPVDRRGVPDGPDPGLRLRVAVEGEGRVPLHRRELDLPAAPPRPARASARRCMAELLVRAKAAGIKEIIAVIADRGADASIAMHKSFGFKEIGHMGKVGFKFDRWLGTVLMQKSLK